MWRARPILQQTSLVILACVVIRVASGIISYVRYFPTASLEMIVARRITVETIVPGAIFGLRLAIPMALVTIVFFRDVSKPTFYRWTMVTVALLVTIAQWDRSLERLPWLLNRANESADFTILQHAIVPVLQVYACHFAAGLYLRAALSRSEKDAS